MPARMRVSMSAVGLAFALSLIVVPPQPAVAVARCATSAAGVEQRVAEFWQCVGALRASDHLTAEDLGQWARNVIERAPGAGIRVVDFRASTVAMQGAFDRASVGVPPAAPKSADVEDRIARFWQKVDALGACDTLTATDLGQWALNVIDRDPSKRIRVDDFRSATAGMQGALDRVREPCSQAPTSFASCRGVPFDPARTGIDGYVTWNLEPVGGMEVYVVAGETFGAPRVGTTTTDASGYWKLTGFTDLERQHIIVVSGTDTYAQSGYGLYDDETDPSRLCANRVVRLNTGSGLQARYDSISLRKYIDGVTLRPSAPGAPTLTWDSRAYWLQPSTDVPAGDLTVTWRPLAGATQYCIKLIDSTGGEWVYGKETCSAGTSFTFTGLTAGKSYSVHLLAWGKSRLQHDMIGNELVAFR